MCEGCKAFIEWLIKNKLLNKTTDSDAVWRSWSLPNSYTCSWKVLRALWGLWWGMPPFITQRAGFAWDGPIIYRDTDDVISQMPECLSDMFHPAQPPMVSSKSGALNLNSLAAASVFETTLCCYPKVRIQSQKLRNGNTECVGIIICATQFKDSNKSGCVI